MAFGSFLQSLNVLHVCFVIMVMSQDILQYPRIRSVGNPQIICGIVKGYPQVRQRVSAESSKGILEIIKGYPRNRQRVSANRQRVSADSLKGMCTVRTAKGIRRITSNDNCGIIVLYS